MRSEHGKGEKLVFSLVFEEPTLKIWHIKGHGNSALCS